MNCSASLSFVMNDWFPEVIARNIVMLFALHTDGSKLNADFLCQFWYSVEMTKDAYDYWIEKVRRCLKIQWSERQIVPEFPIGMFDKQTINKVIFVWKAWTESCDWSVRSLEKHRDSYNQYHLKGGHIPVEALVEALNSDVPRENSPQVKAMNQSLAVELKAWFKSGSLVDASRETKVNPSLLLVNPDGSFHYALQYSSHPFESHVIATELGLKKSLLLNIDKLIRAFADSSCSKTYKVTFGCADAIDFMDTLIQKPEYRFDVIETSSLADYCGLLPLLIHGSVLLKPTKEAVLKICTFYSYEITESRDSYLETFTGLPIESFPTLLGLRPQSHDTSNWLSICYPFCKNLLSSGEVPAGKPPEFFVFNKVLAPLAPVSLKDSRFLFDALMNCADTIMCSYQAKLPMSGATPALFSKLLAFACAEQRLSPCGTKFNECIPFDELKILWKGVLKSKCLLSSIPEILTYMQLFGFTNTVDADYHGTPSHVKITVPVIDCEPTPTPVFIIMIKVGVATFFSSLLAGSHLLTV